MSDSTTVNTVLAALIPGVFSLWVGWLSLRSQSESAKQSSQGDYYRGLEERIESLTDRVDELQRRLDEEITMRREEQYRSYLLKLALREHIFFVDEIAAWIEKGSIPPPPDPPSRELRKLLEEN